MIYKFLFTSLFLFTLFSPQLSATNFYIDAIGGNDNNNGTSQNSAWRTLDKLYNSWDRISAGDSVLLKRGQTWAPNTLSGNREGVIQVETNKSGLPNEYIVIGAYGSGNKPIISVKNLPNKKAFRSASMSYLIIQDIEFRGTVYIFSSNINNGHHHLKFLRLIIDGKDGSTNTQGGIIFLNDMIETSPETYTQPPLHDIEVGHSLIRNTAFGETGIKFYSSTLGRFWIHHNEVINSGNGGITIAGGDNTIIEYNLISGAKDAGMKIQPQASTLNNLTIRGNIISNSGDIGLIAYNLTNSKIYNNTITQFGTNPAAILGWWPSSPVYISSMGTKGFENNLIQNNIFYGARIILSRANGVKITYKNGTQIRYYQKRLWENNLFQNNTFYRVEGERYLVYETEFGPTNYVSYSDNAPGNYISTEYTTGGWMHLSEFNNKQNVSENIGSNPLFNSTLWSSPENYGDYSLKTNSPSRESGRIISNYLTDLLGNRIPNAIKPDRGAIQSSSSISPPPPTNGTDLFKPALGNYESSTGSWVKYGNNNIQTSTEYAQLGSRSLKITYGNNAAGAYLYLSKNYDLVDNLVEGKTYRLSFWAKTNSGTSKIVLRDALKGIQSYEATINSTFKKYEIDFIATHTFYNYIKLEGLSSGQSVFIDNLQLLSGESGNTNNPTLTNLFEGSKGGYESNIGSWQKYGNNSFQTSSEYSSSGSRSLKVTSVNNNAGGYLYLNKSYDLSADLIVGKQYILTFWAKTYSGSAKVMVRDAMKGILDYSVVVSNSPKKYEIVFNATHTIYNYIKFEGLSSGQSIYIDDLELYDLSESNNRPSSNNSPLGKMQLDINAELMNGEVNLSWFNFGDDIVNYEVQRTNSEMEKDWVAIKTINNSSSEIISFNDKPSPGNYIYRIRIETRNGFFELSNEVSVSVVPVTFELFQNYPNPFNPSTKITYALPFDSNVKVEVFNMLGEIVEVLQDGVLSAGGYEKVWNAGGLASGIYIVRVSAKSVDGKSIFMDSKKMQLLK